MGASFSGVLLQSRPPEPAHGRAAPLTVPQVTGRHRSSAGPPAHFLPTSGQCSIFPAMSLDAALCSRIDDEMSLTTSTTRRAPSRMLTID